MARSNPKLAPERREELVRQLVDARRSIAAAKRSGDADAETSAHVEVQVAKVALGERGPFWWDDGEPDLNRRMARTTRYADWHAAMEARLVALTP